MCVMKTMTVREAQHNFARVLQEVEAGHPVEIRRREKPVARLLSVEAAVAEAATADWTGHRERMASIWGRKRLTGVDTVLDELRGDR